VASAGGLNASDQHPSQAGSGLSDNAHRRPIPEAKKKRWESYQRIQAPRGSSEFAE
jgi:hypothetical protein